MFRLASLFLFIFPCTLLAQKVAVVDVQKVFDGYQKVKDARERLEKSSKIAKEEIDIFNKKAIYLYLREITGLNTKQIVNSLKKFRKRYSTFKNDWENGLL